MLQQDTIDFLRGTHPFDLLPDSALERLCKGAALEYFRSGAQVLEQGGTASEHLFVIKRGTVSMFLDADKGDEVVLDYRGEGEYFGLMSVVSGESPRGGVRAEEDTIALLIPKPDLLETLDEHPTVSDKLVKSYLLDLIDKTTEETRRRNRGRSNGHRILFATPVGEMVHREPVAAAEDTPIQEAARLMAEHGISSLVVVDRSDAPVGIMTDRDLREKVVAAGCDLSQPVTAIMSSPIIQVEADEPGSEALFKMMRHNIHHVLVTDGGEFKGMVTNHDFMVLQGNSPTLLIRKVLETSRLDGLREARNRLVETISTLSREGASGQNLSRSITEVTRTLIARTASLVETELGPPAVPISLFMCGEAGRSELTLGRGPELAIAYDDACGDLPQEHISALVDYLSSKPVCARFPHGESARSYAAWRERLQRWIEDKQTDENNATPGLLEMNAVCGESRAIDRLRAELLQAATGREAFRARLAAAALSNRPPLGFLGQRIVATSGEHRNQLDLYAKALTPLADIVRVLAIDKKLLARPTRVRLDELRSLHGYDRTDEVANALEYVQSLRIHQQLAHLEAGEEPDDLLDPRTLANSERKTLKKVFQLIAELQESLSRLDGPGGGDR